MALRIALKKLRLCNVFKIRGLGDWDVKWRGRVDLVRIVGYQYLGGSANSSLFARVGF